MSGLATNGFSPAIVADVFVKRPAARHPVLAAMLASILMRIFAESLQMHVDLRSPTAAATLETASRWIA